MSNTRLDDPHRTREGDAEEAGPPGRNYQQTTDSPGKVIGANRHTKLPTQVQSHTNVNPKVELRGKTFRITHLNTNNSREALSELTKIRSRDNLLIVSEPPAADGVPLELEGYTKIHGDENPRICAYIKDNIIHATSQHTGEKYEVTMYVGDRLVRGIYAPPQTTPNPPPGSMYDPMKEGEVRMGDYKAHHPAWMDGEPTDKRGRLLFKWMTEEGVEERGPRESTHDQGHKIDLIFTKDTPTHRTNIMHNGTVEFSDHKCQSISFTTMIPIETTIAKTDYRKTPIAYIQTIIESMEDKEVKTPEELIEHLESIRAKLPTKRYRDRNRLPQEVLDNRRTLKRALRDPRVGKLEVRELRSKYRKSIRDHDNSKIAEQLEESNDKDLFFKLSKKGTTKKAIPPMKDDDGTWYRTHDEISDHMATHHGRGDPVTENPKRNDDIPPITEEEVDNAIDKAPTNSTIGADDIGIPLLKAYQKTKPGTIAKVMTEIVRSGKHPDSWKEATVVPIPKANKPSYDKPKSWRSLHLLSVVSKTLERIVLRRIQENVETLGPTQFGSRRHTGTSDAFQIFRDWKFKAERDGYETAFISADIEGGFDKVDTEHFKNATTDIDPKYNDWIYNWTQNRRIRFRFNGKTNGKEYVLNRGVPQGSPLSPFLFGAYVKDIMEEDVDFIFYQNVFIISYVDDLLICIKGKDQKEVERIGRAAWARIKERAKKKGMTFADNKTKTWGTRGVWHIGQAIKEMRFLGYWVTEGKDDFDMHIKHWLTKANFTFNQLRAMTQRIDGNKGLNSLSTIRHLHATTRTIATYGLEHFGYDEGACKQIDSFMYEAIKRLFDLPIATPHRALSAEFALTPTHIQRDYIRERVEYRHRRFPHIMIKARQHGNMSELHPASSDRWTTETTLPWSRPVPDAAQPPIDRVSEEEKESIRDVGYLRRKIGSTGAIIYTDGSKRSTENASYGIAILNYLGNLTETDDGKLSPGKSILDAEAMAIYKAMEIILNKDYHHEGITSHVYILSDSTAAIDTVHKPKTEGPLAYLNDMRGEIETHPNRRHVHFHLGWVKGHSKLPGNDLADTLAKGAQSRKDPIPGQTHAFELAEITSKRQKAWEEWYDKQTHRYVGRPTRRLKQHRHMTRLDTSTLFRLRSNKGWTPNDVTGIEPPPNCETCQTTRDGDHIMICPETSTDRPPDIRSILFQPKRKNDVMNWIKKHHHFGLKMKVYNVRFISLRIGKINTTADVTCYLCDKIFSDKSNLTKHVKNQHTDRKPSKRIPPLTPEEKTCPEPNCTKTFVSRKTRNDHIKTHENARLRSERNAKDLTCEICNQRSTCTSNHKTHMARMHGMDIGGDLTCHGCSTVYRSKGLLKEHQRSNCGGSRS